MMEGIHGRIRYLGRKGKPRKCERGSQRIQKRIPMRHGRYKMTREGERNVQKRRTTRTIYSKKSYLGGQINNMTRNIGEDWKEIGNNRKEDK